MNGTLRVHASPSCGKYSYIWFLERCGTTSLEVQCLDILSHAAYGSFPQAWASQLTNAVSLSNLVQASGKEDRCRPTARMLWAGLDPQPSIGVCPLSPGTALNSWRLWEWATSHVFCSDPSPTPQSSLAPSPRHLCSVAQTSFVAHRVFDVCQVYFHSTDRCV